VGSEMCIRDRSRIVIDALPIDSHDNPVLWVLRREQNTIA